MPTDKQNVEFMWAIVKQLEIKHIDWNIVASANSISNGHAARMRFHRLRQAMEGIATKHRTAKTMEDGPEKSMGKDKSNTKISKSRKAKDLALKRKFADISDDEEEPLAHVKARLRMKEELEDSEDEYVDSETEEKRAVQKQIRREEAIKREQDERSVSPKTVKVEKVDCPTSFSSRIESTLLKVEIMEDPFLIMEPGEAIAVKSEFVLEDDAIMIDSAPTPIDDMEIKEEGFEALVEV